MDAALYLCLRDELQQDAARVERQLEELRKVESFLLKRIHPSRNLASYRAVLQDLSLEISRAESDQAEYLRLSRFVTKALVTSYVKAPDSPRSRQDVSDPTPKDPPAKESAKAPASPERVAPQRALQDAPKSKEPAKSNGPIAPAQADAGPVPQQITKPVAKAEPPLKTGIIEFDKDGFPLVAAPGKSSAMARSPSAIAFQETPPISEPPTVVFDENGFPLNPPTDESLKTLMEVPNPQAAPKPLSKNDK
jgi:hypothetical protein